MKINKLTKKTKIIVIIAASILLAAVLGLLIAAVSGKSKDGGKTILSCDFEDGFSGFTEDAYYGLADFERVKEGADGGFCLKITNNGADDSRLKKSINLKKDAIYELSCDIKLLSVSGEHAKGALVCIDSLYADGVKAIETVSEDWENLKVYVKVSKTGDYDAAMRLGYFSSDTKGAALYDNFTVRRVSSAPKGETIITIGNPGESNPATPSEEVEDYQSDYFNAKSASVFFMIFVVLFFGTWYLFVDRYDKYENKLSDTRPFEKDMGKISTLVTIVLIALALRIVLSVTYFQCSIDVNLFKSWGNTVAKDGLSKLYTDESNCDYPPLYMLILGITSFVSGIFNNATAETILVKLPSILSDIGTGFLIYAVCGKKKFSRQWTWFLMGLWLFNPLVILDSACWGQVDSLLALIVAACAYLENEKKHVPAALLFGLGIMLKPQMIIFAPAFGCAFIVEIIRLFKEKQSKKAGMTVLYTILAGVTGLILPAVTVVSKMITLFTGTIGHYQYATVNCFNFWFLIGKNWVADSEKFFGWTYYGWGMLAIVIISLFVVFIYAYLLIKKKCDASVLYLTAAMLYLMVSDFGPRMHERYFYPALLLLIFALIETKDKKILGGIALTSVFGFFSVHEVMIGLECGNEIKKLGGDYAVYSDMYWPKLNVQRGIIAGMMVVSALFVTYLAFARTFSKNCENKTKEAENEK